MKTSSLSLSAAAAAVLGAAIVAAAMSASAAAQAPQSAQPAQGGQAQMNDGVAHPARQFPAPTNLKVLPKTLSGKQVRDIMEGWSGALGVHCDTCHTKDGDKKTPQGWPVLKFEDDTKPEKNAARLMVKMTRDINDNYVSMVDMGHEEHEDHAAHKVTCGTCHRGHLKPEAFVPPREHEGPRPVPAHPGM